MVTILAMVFIAPIVNWVVYFLSIIVFYTLMRWLFKKFTRKESDLQTETADVPAGPGDYEPDSDDQNLFCNLMNSDFAVRVYKSYANKKKSGPDALVFATSIKHNFTEHTKQLMLSSIFQLVDVDFEKSHELLITKSGPSKFVDIEDAILSFIFVHLHREYDWQNVEQIVNVRKCDNPHLMIFSMKEETCRHKDLGVRLNNVKGRRDKSTGVYFMGGGLSGFPMDGTPGVYEFILAKAFAFTWEEVLPEIKNVFTDYFVGGVKFTGDWE